MHIGLTSVEPGVMNGLRDARGDVRRVALRRCRLRSGLRVRRRDANLGAPQRQQKGRQHLQAQLAPYGLHQSALELDSVDDSVVGAAVLHSKAVRTMPEKIAFVQEWLPFRDRFTWVVTSWAGVSVAHLREYQGSARSPER